MSSSATQSGSPVPIEAYERALSNWKLWRDRTWAATAPGSRGPLRAELVVFARAAFDARDLVAHELARVAADGHLLGRLVDADRVLAELSGDLDAEARTALRPEGASGWWWAPPETRNVGRSRAFLRLFDVILGALILGFGADTIRRFLGAGVDGHALAGVMFPAALSVMGGPVFLESLRQLFSGGRREDDVPRVRLLLQTLLLTIVLAAVFGQWSGLENRAAALDREGARLLGELRVSDALRRFQLAASLNPESVSAHFHRGLALERMYDYDAAAQAYERALALNDRVPKALNNLARLKVIKGDTDRALALLVKLEPQVNHAGAIMSDKVAYLKNLAWVLLKLEEKAAAVVALDQAIAHIKAHSLESQTGTEARILRAQVLSEYVSSRRQTPVSEEDKKQSSDGIEDEIEKLCSEAVRAARSSNESIDATLLAWAYRRAGERD